MPYDKKTIAVTVSVEEHRLFREYATIKGRSLSNFALISMRAEFRRHASAEQRKALDLIVTSRLR